VGVATPLQVAVSEPPRGTLDALALKVGPLIPTVIVLLETMLVKPSFASNRSSYGPALNETGIVNTHVPEARATVGNCEQLT
jgi:hypothetical protein